MKHQRITLFSKLNTLQPHHTTPRHIKPHHATSNHTTPHHTTPHHTTPHHTTPYHTTPHHITSHHITSHHTTPCWFLSKEVRMGTACFTGKPPKLSSFPITNNLGWRRVGDRWTDGLILLLGLPLSLLLFSNSSSYFS